MYICNRYTCSTDRFYFVFWRSYGYILSRRLKYKASLYNMIIDWLPSGMNTMVCCHVLMHDSFNALNIWNAVPCNDIIVFYMQVVSVYSACFFVMSLWNQYVP